MSFNNKAIATKLDTDSQAFLKLANEAEGPLLEEMSLQEARDSLKQLYVNAGEPTQTLVHQKDIKISRPHGELKLRLYQARLTEPNSAPVVLFFHGGGWSLGDVEAYEGFCQFMAVKSGAIIISVEYGLSPENKFPHGLLDCFASLQWVAKNATKIGIDPARIAVMGDSAGGNIAALTAVRARDIGIKLKAQILLYPVLDLEGGTQFKSRVHYGAGEHFISQSSIAWTVDLYLEQKLDENLAHNLPHDLPLPTPLHLENLENLAPALTIVGGFDPLRDECHYYAERLAKAGVKSEFRCYHTTIHGFLSYSSALSVGKTGLAETASWLKANL